MRAAQLVCCEVVLISALKCAACPLALSFGPLPLPDPSQLVGAFLVFAMTVGHDGADIFLAKGLPARKRKPLERLDHQ
jgi:hypothetical protein